MTGREKYNKYCEMVSRISTIHDNYCRYLQIDCNATIISDCFISVGNEEHELYFVDIEYLNSVGVYERKYGNYDMKRFY